MKADVSLDSKVSGPGRGRRGLAAGALLTCVLAGAGCYNPSIATGGFKCSSEFKKECPDGFSCVNGLCWKGGVAVDAAVDVKVDGPVELPAVKTDAMEAPVEKPPPACTIKPVAGCTPQAGKCDPLCQSGCDGCHQKCSVATTGALTCNDPTSSNLGMDGDACDYLSPGTEQQSDDCAPGLVCVERSCKKECAKLCRADADCPGSTCSRDYAPGFRVCDVKTVACNPVKLLGAAGCPGAAQGCYLSPTITDRTVCDCPFLAVGEGKTCKFSRDCLPGLVCVDATGTTDFRCYIACTLIGATSGCTGVQTCHALNGSTKFGYCRN